MITTIRRVARRFGVEISRYQDPYRLHLYPAGDRSTRPHYNIGAGDFSHPCWTSLDFVSEHYRSVQRNCLHHDLMKLGPLPIAAGTAKTIYTSHCIEHVSEAAVANLFAEAYRALMPGGILRVTTGPDADTDYAAVMRGDADWFYWNAWYSKPGTYEHLFHAPADSVPLEERWLHHVASQLAPNALTPSDRKLPASEVRAILHAMPKETALDYFTSLVTYDPKYPENHITWWNAAKILRFMREAGFANTYRSGFGQSASPLMRQSSLFDHTHPQISVYVEAVR